MDQSENAELGLGNLILHTVCCIDLVNLPSNLLQCLLESDWANYIGLCRNMLSSARTEGATKTQRTPASLSSRVLGTPALPKETS